VLREHRRRQFEQRDGQLAAGRPWVDSGYVFTRPVGTPINPNYATTQFRKLTDRSGLPPVRLHDLRHGAASLAHQAGADLKTLQDLLGHSSIVVTADTYTSVLPAAQRRCADATAAPGPGSRPPHPPQDQGQATQILGGWLRDVMAANAEHRNFRIMGPLQLGNSVSADRGHIRGHIHQQASLPVVTGRFALPPPSVGGGASNRRSGGGCRCPP
jgi:hypothetical protein